MLLPFEIIRKVEYWDFVDVTIDGAIKTVRIPKYGSPTIGELNSPEFFTKHGIVSAALRRRETLPQFEEAEIEQLIDKLTKLELECCVQFMQNEISEWNDDQKKDPEPLTELPTDPQTGAESISSSDTSTLANPDSALESSNTARFESSLSP